MLLIMVSIICIAQQILLVKLIRNSDWFRAKLQRANLSSERKEQIRKLESDRAEIASWIPVHERALLVATTGESSFQHRYHSDKLAGLRAKIGNIDEQIALIEAEPPTYDPWIAIRPQLGANTPGGCLHLKPEPVFIDGETEPVNWVCSDCFVKLENGDQAVVARKATDLKKKLREDADRQFNQMFQPPSPEERKQAERHQELAERLLRQEKVIYGPRSTSDFIEIKDGAGNSIRRVEY